MLGRLKLGGLELTLGNARSGASKTCLQQPHATPVSLELSTEVRLIPLKGPVAQRLRATQASGPFLFVANNSSPENETEFSRFRFSIIH